MDLFSEYENMQVITEGETKTFRARQAVTHCPVLLHQLSSNPRSGRQLHLLALVLRYTSSLCPGGPSPILRIEEQGDSVWVITEDRPELTNLWDWMERETAKKVTPEGVTPAPPAPAQKESSSPAPSGESSSTLHEKTLLFATRLAAADSSPLIEFDAAVTSPSAPAAPEKVSPISQPTVPSTTLEPGEVTRYFTPQSDSSTQSRKEPPAAETIGDSTVMLPRPAGESESGVEEERTKIISTPMQTGQHGEFTMIFKTPPAHDPSVQSASLLPADDRPAGPSEKPGEFTMLFRKPPGSPVAGEQKPRFMGFTAPTPEKTKFIDASSIQAPGRPPAPPAASTPRQTVAAAPPPETVQAPGELTAMFGSPAPGRPPETEVGFPQIPDFPGPQENDQFGSSQPGEFTQTFRRTQSSHDPALQSAAPHEPGAFTRIFQIPVGSDLLTAAESQNSAPHATAPMAPPVWRPEPPASSATNVPLGAPLPPNPSAPPAAEAGGVGKPIAPPPALKPNIPHIPQAPKLEVPRVMPLKTPPVAAPKAPQLSAIGTLQGAPAPSILPLILIFGGIALAAVLIVLFFVMKH